MFEHLSPQMHLVVANRTDPSLPLSWLRKRGQMVEARVDDLRFTPDNVADYLTRALRMSSCPCNQTRNKPQNKPLPDDKIPQHRLYWQRKQDSDKIRRSHYLEDMT